MCLLETHVFLTIFVLTRSTTAARCWGPRGCDVSFPHSLRPNPIMWHRVVTKETKKLAMGKLHTDGCVSLAVSSVDLGNTQSTNAKYMLFKAVECDSTIVYWHSRLTLSWSPVVSGYSISRPPWSDPNLFLFAISCEGGYCKTQTGTLRSPMNPHPKPPKSTTEHGTSY